MLDTNDIEIIRKLFQEETNQSEKRLTEIIENRTGFLIEEMDRLQSNLEKKVERLQKNLDEINQYYRITKLENDNTTLMIQIMNDLIKRIEDLERKTA